MIFQINFLARNWKLHLFSILFFIQWIPSYDLLCRNIKIRKKCIVLLSRACFTAQEIKFPIKDFFSKCDQIHKKLWIWSYLLKKSLMENFIFCALFSAIKVHENLCFLRKFLETRQINNCWYYSQFKMQPFFEFIILKIIVFIAICKFYEKAF